VSTPQPTRLPAADGSGPGGAYGFRLSGIDGARKLLVDAAPDWPAIRIEREVGRATGHGDFLDGDRAAIRLENGGEILLERRAATALFRMPAATSDHEIVHPYLAPAAAIAARWHGRESFHAGAFVTAGGAWALLGDKGAGKSSTLAALASRGHTILCDDVLVVADEVGLAGPRTLDLRGEPARHFGVGRPLGKIGARERWRVQLGQSPAAAALRGWFFLAWGDRVELEPLGPAQRLVRLAGGRAVRVPSTTPEALLTLASFPAWELRRPRGWDSLDPSLDRLLAAASG
jgi:hypothetical protein